MTAATIGSWRMAIRASRAAPGISRASRPIPHNPDIVYIPNVALYKLADGGKTLSIVRGAPGGDDYHQLWIDPADSLRMVLATDQGTSVTIDGGETWSTWYNQPTAQFYHVITDNDFPYHIYGSQQDSGTAGVASRTDTGQIDTRDWFSVGGSESGYIAPDPKNPSILYVSSIYGDVGRFDRRTMQTRTFRRGRCRDLDRRSTNADSAIPGLGPPLFTN